MEKRKKLLFVSTQMEAGGVQVIGTELVSAFRSEGADARIVFLYTKRDVFGGTDGVFSLSPSKPKGLVDYSVLLWRLLYFIIRFKPEVIVGLAHYSSPISAIFGTLCRVPVRIGTQTNPPKTVSWAGRALDWACGTFGLYTANLAASKTVEGCFTRFPSGYRRTLKTVYNGIKFRCSDMTKAEARLSFGFDPEEFLLVTCGRLSPQKNQAFLFRVLESLPNVRLAIAGDGELRGDLEAEVVSRGLQDRVRLVGEIPPDRVPEFMRCGDAFVFPSKFEAFGLALVEAMFAGLPVIAADHPALLEVAADAGILLSLNDVEAWEKAIRTLQIDASYYAALSLRSIHRAQAFRFETMLEGFRQEMV